MQSSPPQDLELLANLDAAIAQLSEEHRDLVVRHYLRGQSQVDLATGLRISQGTVSRRIQSSLDALRERLEQAGVTASPSLPCRRSCRCRSTPRCPKKNAASGPATRPADAAQRLAALAGLALATAIAVAVYSATRPTATHAASGPVKEIPAMNSVNPDKPANVIHNAPPLKWQIGQQCTHIGAMQVALAMMGEEVSYNELMGLSGRPSVSASASRGAGTTPPSMACSVTTMPRWR